MVQAALIDYALDSKDAGAADALKRFAARQDVNPAVRQRADVAVRELAQYR